MSAKNSSDYGMP